MKDSTFLTQFLLLSDMRTYLMMGILFLCFAGLYILEKRKVKFSKRMLMGTGIGFLLGIGIQWVGGFPKEPNAVLWLHEVSSWYGLIGNGFMDLLKMLVIPLVFLSLVRVIMNMKGNNLGKMASRTIGMLVGTTLIAATIGIFLGTVFKLGTGLNVDAVDATIREMKPLVETLRGLLPANPVKAMADANIVGVVIFAILIGLAVRRQSEKYAEVIKPFRAWVEAFYKIILSVAMTIIRFMPYAVVTLLANTIISRGMQVLADVIKFIAVLYLGVIIMLAIHMVIALLNGISPKAYLTKGIEPLVLAFTSRSSLGTLPVLIETLEQKFEVDEGVASFVGSLGANMGMNGCAGLYPALVVVMLGQMLGVPMDLGFYFVLVIVIAVSSFGIAGLPGTATLAVSVVVAGMGLGEYFPLVGAIIAIDPIIDMGRTMLNVSGTMTSALVVAKSMEKGNKE